MDNMEFKVKELLKEVRLDDSTTKAIDQVVSSVIEAIESIPEQLVTSDAAAAFVRDIGAPPDKVSFEFKRPDSIQVGGSHSIRCLVKPDINVDLLIRMPKDCFHEKDYLNHRYHAKRCLYLRVIEKSLKSCPAVRKITWSSFKNEARKPLLIIFPATEVAGVSDFSISLIPTATSLFNNSRLSLTRNNVRAFSKCETTLATPYYNSSILEDMFLEDNSECVRKVFNQWRSLEDALVLLKVNDILDSFYCLYTVPHGMYLFSSSLIWARNRSSIYTHDCLSGFLISIILSSFTAQTTKGECVIAKSMSAMEIFRVTLVFLATSNLLDKGHSLHSHSTCIISEEDMNQFLQSFDVVILDASCLFNLTYRATKAAFLELQDEATRTLECINKYGSGGFEEIFVTKVDFAAKFDSCMRLNLKGNAKVSASKFCMDDELWRAFEKDVNSLLQQGLGDRVKLIRAIWNSTPYEWSVVDGLTKFNNEPMLVGLLLSSQDKSFRVVDIGPNPENKSEAINFRKFWGDKAELRRFRDGTIAESTVWDCQPWERHTISKKIAEYVLTKHLLLSKENIVHLVDQLDFCLQLGGKDPTSASNGLLRAFELLSKRLRLLEDIPLRISSVQPLDPALRHTSVFPPQPHPLAIENPASKRLPKFTTTCIQPIEVMIQLEGSGNWPLDHVAVENTKSAFLLKIGESLQDRWGITCIASEDEVNVLMSGYAFLLRIFHERGMNSISKNQGGGTVKGVHSIDRELFLKSQHSSMINGLHGRFPIYEPVVRLAKRWVSVHLFSSSVAEEAIELLVAYLFVKPYPFHTPCSRITGFLRFLRLLSDYDWTFSPLIVDINHEFTKEDEKEINERFILSRKSHEENAQNFELAMFLAAPYDKTSEAWTKSSPSNLVLKRIAAYARSSADLLSNLILQGVKGSYRWECLFRTPLNNYDAVVLLHRDKLSYPHHILFPSEIENGKLVICGKASKVFSPYIQLASGAQSLLNMRNNLMVNFDPVRCFLEDLKREFPSNFKLWYDSIGGDAIGLTWDKSSKKRVRGEEDEIRNIIDELKVVGEVGKGLVKSIHLLKAPRLK